MRQSAVPGVGPNASVVHAGAKPDVIARFFSPVLEPDVVGSNRIPFTAVLMVTAQRACAAFPAGTQLGLLTIGLVASKAVFWTLPSVTTLGATGFTG